MSFAHKQVFNACNAGLRLYNYFNASACRPELIDGIKGWHIPKPAEGEDRATLVYGATLVSGIVAARAADAANEGLTGDTIYMLGGVPVAGHLLAPVIFPILEEQGIPRPSKGEREGPYMKRVFEEKAVGYFDVRVDNKSRHTQANLSEAFELGALKHDSLVHVAHPAMLMRAMGTADQSMRGLGNTGEDRAVFHARPAWLPEIGVAEETWQDSPFGVFYNSIESGKLLRPTPEQAKAVTSGWTLPVSFGAPEDDKVPSFNLQRERARSFGR